MEKIDIAIIGAGVVGLAIGARLSKLKPSIYVLERHNSFGQETSSRNSEVIHAGIYYIPGSLKAKTCVEGNQLLYEICRKHKIPHKRCGKLIVANSKEDEDSLMNILKRARGNGVEGLKILSKKNIQELEPKIIATAALFSESTGIIDSHSLMEYFIQKIKDNGSDVVYNSEVVAAEKSNSGYKLTIQEKQGDKFSIDAGIVINSAGLESDKIALRIGINIKKEGYDLKYCKGQYFRVNQEKAKLLSYLVYPVPKPSSAGLGIHATLDLAGGLRLGPDDKYIAREKIDYNVDINDRDKFFSLTKSFLPFLEKDDLMPDTAGIRPKLQGEGEPERDFVIKEETKLGFPGFINLIGIESPGLTSAIAIARYVESLVRQRL
ncbi:MAG: NAD(P)/FAD-dependent oxidoreductase [Candidatus Omnitrophota bacterium]|nr:NAD(P)/FAD-dependent oxidoreductase [Candidatus Omnitrophota bacterium]